MEEAAEGRAERIRAYETKKRKLDDQAMRGYDKAYEAKKRKNQQKLHNSKKKVAASSSTGRTRQCKDCGKTFNGKQYYDDHVLMVHKGFNPYVCDYCDKVFTQAHMMKTHMKSGSCQRK